MSINTAFIKAVHDYASGESKKSTLQGALIETKPSMEDKQWVLSIYAKAAGETLPDATADFTETLTRLIDKVGQEPDASYSVAPKFNDDSRGDEGVHIRRRKELGMGYDDGSIPVFERSAGRILYEALWEAGWRAVYALKTIYDTNFRYEKINTIFEFAEQRGLSQEICCFKRGEHSYTMLSPKLIELYVQEFVPDPIIEKKKPGERAMSMFTENRKFPQLVETIKNALSSHGILPEIVLVKRQPSNKRGKDPICLTPALQEVLSEKNIIRIQNIYFHGPAVVNTKLIPEPANTDALEKLAQEICMALKEKLAATQQNPAEKGNPLHIRVNKDDQREHGR